MNSPFFTLVHQHGIVDQIVKKHFTGQSYLGEDHVNSVKKFIEGNKAELSENLHLLTCVLEGLCPMVNKEWVPEDGYDVQIAEIYEGFDCSKLESKYSTLS